MKLASMKMPKRKKSDNMPEAISSYDDHEAYPYGLRIRLEREQIKNLPGVTGLKVGDAVSISGLGKIVGVRIEEMKGRENDHSVEIQIEQFGVEKKKPLKEMSMKEYNEARSKGAGK